MPFIEKILLGWNFSTQPEDRFVKSKQEHTLAIVMISYYSEELY